MKSLRRFLIVITLLQGFFWITGCKNNNPYSNSYSSLIRSGSTVINATPAPKNAQISIDNIPVNGGTLDVETAWINIADLSIEENSGLDVEQEGEHNDGDQSESDNEAEQEAPDITAVGPFNLDISNGQSPIGSFDVYPGTFKKIDFYFQPNINDPLFGKSIIISGEFTSDEGSITPFTLRSEFSEQIQTQIADGGITVAENATVEINIVFDIAGWFGNIDFLTAQTVDGQVLIDTGNNPDLLAVFESNLSEFTDIEENE